MSIALFPASRDKSRYAGLPLTAGFTGEPFGSGEIRLGELLDCFHAVQDLLHRRRLPLDRREPACRALKMLPHIAVAHLDGVRFGPHRGLKPWLFVAFITNKDMDLLLSVWSVADGL